MILALVDEAVTAGAREERAGEVIGIAARTLARWRAEDGGEDRRKGPATPPPHKLDEAERQRVLETANSVEFRDLSPRQIVPRLADAGLYIASESTFYRVLREEGQLAHRSPARPAQAHKPKEHVARGPNEVWSWDITYLRSAVRGAYFYLYMVIDVYSRKIVGWEVHIEESAQLAAELVQSAIHSEGADAKRLVLHSDNGGPMKGSTMLATLQRLGVIASFSRPSVSDDNPFAEALFRTLKYRLDIRQSRLQPSSLPAPGSRASSPGTTVSTCTAASATSRPRTATPDGTRASSPSATSSTPRPRSARRSAGRARRATGRPSAPCTSTPSNRRRASSQSPHRSRDDFSDNYLDTPRLCPLLERVQHVDALREGCHVEDSVFPLRVDPDLANTSRRLASASSRPALAPAEPSTARTRLAGVPRPETHACPPSSIQPRRAPSRPSGRNIQTFGCKRKLVRPSRGSRCRRSDASRASPCCGASPGATSRVSTLSSSKMRDAGASCSGQCERIRSEQHNMPLHPTAGVYPARG